MTYNHSIINASEYEQIYDIGAQKQIFHQGAVAEWSKALIIKQKVLGSSPLAGNIFLDGSSFANFKKAVYYSSIGAKDDAYIKVCGLVV